MRLGRLATASVAFLLSLCSVGSLLAGSLLVSWDPVQDSRLAGYRIRYGTFSGNYTGIADVGNNTSYLLQNLTEGTRYYLIIVPYDSDRTDGTASLEVSGVVLSISGTTATSITHNTAVVSWQTNKPADNQVDYGLTTVYGSLATSAALVMSHSQTLTNLQPSTTYHFRVRSRDDGGSTSISSDFSFTTGNPPDTAPPGNVTSFTAIPGNGRISLSWTNPTDSDFRGVTLRYRTDGTYPANRVDGSLALDRAGVAGARDYFDHLNLTNGATYYYSAFTYDTNENFSSTARVQATPANLSITSISPIRGTAGTPVTITGSGFGATQGSSTVTFNGLAAQVSSWSATSITAVAPPNATSGLIVVTVNGAQTNGVYFRVGDKLGPPSRPRLRV